MMLNLLIQLLAEERIKVAQREAEESRLIRQARQRTESRAEPSHIKAAKTCVRLGLAQETIECIPAGCH